MTWLSCSLPESRVNERGAVLVLNVFIVVTLLAIGGLAIDAGNLYRARLWLQKAADAGALGGIGATIHLNEQIQGMDANQKKDFITFRAREIANENLLNDGIVVDPAVDISAEYVPVRQTESGQEIYRLNVYVRADIPHLLLHLVPFDILGGGRVGAATGVNAAAARASAERAVANISLVLDISNSMACPSKGACTCLTPDRTNTCDEEALARGVPTKLNLLREAVNTFVEQFDENIDRISLVPFNMVATLDFNYESGGKAVRFEPADTVGKPAIHGFKLENFEKAMNNFIATSNTNICDAFTRSYEEAMRVGLVNPQTPETNREISYVYFSDGAPTAGRFLLADISTLPPHSHGTPGMGSYDYINYTVNWVEAGDSEGEYQAWQGPSPLVQTASMPIDHSEFKPPKSGVPACSSETGEPISDPDAFDSMFSGCLSSMAAHVPFDPSSVYGSEYGSVKTFSEGWREQYYNCAVQLSDFLRSQRGSLYVIGLGEPSDVTDDPYQDVTDTLQRKDFFLARVANDYALAHRIPLSEGQQVHPEFQYGGYRTYQELQSSVPPREGLYRPTENPEDLVDLFKQMATDILLRLVR